MKAIQSIDAWPIPYEHYIDDGVLLCDNGALLSVYRLGGAMYECVEDAAVNRQREALNQLIRSIASPEVSLWVNAIRSRTTLATRFECADANDSDPKPDTPFETALNRQWHALIGQESLYDNAWYLTILYNYPKAPSDERAKRLGKTLALSEINSHQREGFEQCCLQIESALKDYQLRKLRLNPNTRHCELATFLSELLSFERQDRPRPIESIRQTLLTKDMFSGWETIEVRGVQGFRLIAALGIREYPSKTYAGMLDRLLGADFEWNLTQSFTTIPKNQALALLQRQAQRLFNANDPAQSQQRALAQACDALASNEFVLGDHHFSLFIKTPEYATHHPDSVLLCKANLAQSVGEAVNLCAQAGILSARENIGLEAAYWSQLPGNHRLRPRVVPLTSRNFSSLVSIHALPQGQARRNPWGDCVMPLKTAAKTLYYFSMHPPSAESDPSLGGQAGGADEPSNEKLSAAHTLICGPTGSGKTIFAATLISQLRARRDPVINQVVFDKDQGLRACVEALRGSYEIFRSDGGTSLNPLSLPDSVVNRHFLVRWLSLLIPRIQSQSNWEHSVDAALSGVYQLPVAERRLSRLREFFDPTEMGGAHTHLARWCESTNGLLAPLFDNHDDQWQALFQQGGLLGIDMTSCLKNDEIREPLTAYLFHLIDQRLNGPPTVVWIDEFASFIKDAAFSDFVDNACRTWRKRNGVMALITQSPSDIADSAIARTLIEQIPTRVFFPNSNAQQSAYCELYGLNEREFTLVKSKLPFKPHQFLIKQPNHSVVVELNLSKLPQVLSTLTGKATPRRTA